MSDTNSPKSLLSEGHVTVHKVLQYLEGYGVEEHGEEPVEGDGGQLDVEAAEMTTDGGQLLADELLQHLLVRSRTSQPPVEVVRREIPLRDRHQTPALPTYRPRLGSGALRRGTVPYGVHAVGTRAARQRTGGVNTPNAFD